ncbi:unnamed protein product [Nezara viridula]|uniref:Uncharacterized protein n=1 Tax=Nezara viridula TaxID=85310 RepID=A0A9P0E6J2_NEZVI|nr:unnamed protein product [Nezara viridula]
MDISDANVTITYDLNDTPAVPAVKEEGLSILCFVAALSHAVSEEVLFGPNTWAVLVAGSNGWDNYRHQADFCHAYHSLIRKGVPQENIITLMYDEIAQNPE